MALDARPLERKAELYRMVMPEHLCPFGLKAKSLLQRSGFDVEDHRLETREQTDSFQRREGVDTTPQIYIGGERIGGYDDLREYFGKEVREEGATRYRPVIAIFAVAPLMALAASWRRSAAS